MRAIGMFEAKEVCAHRFSLNGFFVETCLDSAANPKEACKIITKILSFCKEAVSREKFNLKFAKGSQDKSWIYSRIMLLYYDLSILYEDKSPRISVLYFTEIIRVM